IVFSIFSIIDNKTTPATFLSASTGRLKLSLLVMITVGSSVNVSFMISYGSFRAIPRISKPQTRLATVPGLFMQIVFPNILILTHFDLPIFRTYGANRNIVCVATTDILSLRDNQRTSIQHLISSIQYPSSFFHPA